MGNNLNCIRFNISNSSNSRVYPQLKNKSNQPIQNTYEDRNNLCIDISDQQGVKDQVSVHNQNSNDNISGSSQSIDSPVKKQQHDTKIEKKETMTNLQTAMTLDNVSEQGDHYEYLFDYSSIRTLNFIDNMNELYTIGKKIGEGTYGEVRQATHKRLNIELAIKIIDKKNVFNNQSRTCFLLNEIQVLECMNYSFIIHIYELLHDKDYFYIVQELVEEGDMYQNLDQRNLDRKGRLQEKDVQQVAKQLFNALDYLHKRDIVHRDIKLENILADTMPDDSLQIRLTDFGFATFLEKDEKISKGVGSRFYTAPEILDRQKYDYKVDIWSSTVLIYILLCGHMPFVGQNFQEVKLSIKTKDIAQSLKKVTWISEEAREFIKLGLQNDPAQRADSQQMMSHPWLKSIKLKSRDPINSNGVTESLFHVSAGQLIQNNQLEQLVTALHAYDTSITCNLTYTELERQFGCQGLHLLLREYLRRQTMQSVYSLMDVLDNYTDQQQEKGKTELGHRLING